MPPTGAPEDVERLELLDEILDVVLDTDLDDTEVDGAVRALGPKRLANAIRSETERPPRDGGHLELMEARFSPDLRHPRRPRAPPADHPLPLTRIS